LSVARASGDRIGDVAGVFAKLRARSSPTEIT
jgi:hypothetical protein